MYSRSPSRSNRSKGLKVKHILQVCLLVAVCFWLIYQVKHSHEKKKEFDEKDAKLASDNTESGNEIIRLGRKDISRVTEIGTDDKLNGEDDDENEGDQGENRHEDDEQEREESRSEDREEEEDTGKGGEDDENDKGGEERSDEENHEEEFVDEEKDKEESDEKSEDTDDGEKENNEESEAVLEDRDQEVGARNTHEAREEHYKADDASSEVAHDTSIVNDTDNATLKHTNASSELIIDGKENVSHPLLGGNSHEPIEGTNSSDSRVLGINLTDSIDQAQVSNNLTQIKSEQTTNITQAQNATSGDGHNEAFNSTSGDTSGFDSDKNQSDIITVTNSTEPANTTSVESLGSLTEVKLPIAENITIDNPGSNSENNATSGESENAISNTANDDLDSDLHEHVDTSNDDLGSDLHEHADVANDDLGADTANDETDAELHDHDDRIDTSNDETGAELHDHDDDFASTLAQEEKEYRTDTGTLPDIKVEVENAEDIEAE